MDSRATDAEPGTEDLAAVEHAIDALEAQRVLLGDAVVETALAPLQERRARLVDRAGGEQRRLVTVVFADLVGFTALSGQLDAEDTRTIIDRYFSRWLRVIEDHGGVVEKFIGDAVMAVFGLRRSWEDDAQRACRAALAMVADLADLNAGLEQEYAVRLRMRVGIDTGDVVVSTLGDRGGAEFVVVGPTVNRASRLESAAPPDGIMVSAETHRQIRGRFNMERRDGLVLKGIDEPVTAYVVLSERPQGFQLDRAGGVEGVETTTVGREIELRFLQERLWDVVDERTCRLVTVVGEAGVGKTRLLLELDSWLAERPQPVWWFRGRAQHTGQNRANALLRDVLASRLAIAESDSAEAVREKLEAGFAVVFEDAAEATRASHLVGEWLAFDVGDLPAEEAVEPQVLRDRATEALAQYFAGLARRAPVVVLLEDLHWADDGSLRWLDAAAPLLVDAPVLVVATARPSLLEARPRWGEGLDHHVRLPLDALSRRESRLLLEQLLQHVEDPPAELIDLVIGAAEGNPFYIEELVTWTVDAGVVVKAEPHWRVERDLIGRVAVPATLRGVLQARLDALGARERALLQRASVVGRVFWDEAVARLGDAADSTSESTGQAAGATQALDDLRRRELVFEREVSSFDSAREFLFKHALLRDVAYDGVLRTHRQRYHARAAAWLAEVSGRSGRHDEYAALIAEHHDRAGDPAAGRWYLRAAQQAMSVYALTEAARLLDRALALVRDDPALRVDVLLTREAMLDRLGDRVAQDADLVEAESLLAGRAGASEPGGPAGPGGLEDRARLTRLRAARSRLAFVRSEYADAERWADQAAVAAAEAGLAAEHAEARLWQGKSMVWRDAGEQARVTITEALQEARDLGHTRIEAEALRYLSMLATNEGDYGVALDLVAAARESFASVADVEGEGTALSQQATTLFHLGRLTEARAALEQVLPLFRRSGHRYREALVLGNLGTIAMTQGELAVARAYAQQSIAMMREVGDQEAIGNDSIVLGKVATLVGDWDLGEAHLREAVRIGREVGSVGVEADALSKLAFLLVERGRFDDGLSVAREADRVATSAVSAIERGHAQLARGYAELAAGHLDLAEQAFARAQESFAAVDMPATGREALLGRAAVLLARGQAADAVPLVQEVRPHLTREGLEGAARLGTLLRTCVEVWQAAGRPEAADVRRHCRDLLAAAAERVGDREMAAGFRRVPANAALLGVRGQ